jgi:hypothetical protein
MGFFSKVWKGIKTGVKSIGKGIKSAFKKFGKFMGEIGILGQVAMMFILPGIGEMIGSAWSGIAGQTAAQATATATANAATAAAGAQAGASAAAIEAGKVASAKLAAGVTSKTLTKTVVDGVATYASKATGLMAKQGIAQSAGKLMQFVGNSIGTVGNTFNNLTKGITDTLTNFSKTATNNLANKIGMDNVFKDAASNFFGPGDSAFSRSFGKTSRFQRLGISQDVFAAEKQARLNAIDLETKNITAPTPKEFKANVLEKIDTNPENIYDTLEKDLGFRSQGSVGSYDIEYDFGDKKMYTDTKGLSKLQELGLSERLEQYQTGKMYNPSILDKIQAVPGKLVTEGKAFLDDPFAGGAEKLNASLQTAGLQAVGLEDKPEYTYNTMRAYVPEFQMASLEGGGSEPIMSARAFEQNVTNNQNPFGYTAFQYGQYMSQFAQTA